MVNGILDNSNASTEELQKWYDGIGGTHATRCHAVEKIIADSESTVREQWVRMGWALKTIRDDSLYSEDFESFADYVEQKLGYKKSWAYEVIDASEVAKVVPIKAISQARVLAQMEPEEQQAVWERAVENSDGEVTAKAIKVAASECFKDEESEQELPKEFEKQESESQGEHEEWPPSGSDEQKFFNHCTDLRKELRNISAIAKKSILEEDGGHWFDFDQFEASLKNAARILRMATPAADCPYCKGEGCDVCANLGWLPKGVYDALPDSMKE